MRRCVKLLLDENISRRLLAALEPAYPGSSHVVIEGLESASDAEVWTHARAREFVVVSKDDDFIALSSLAIDPPRLIKLSLGNCSNSHVLNALLQHLALIESAFADPTISVVELVPTSSP